MAAGCTAIEAQPSNRPRRPTTLVMDRSDESGCHNEMIRTATTTYVLIRGHGFARPYDAQERVRDMTTQLGSRR
jgi:hypothetical protein